MFCFEYILNLMVKINFDFYKRIYNFMVLIELLMWLVCYNGYEW